MKRIRLLILVLLAAAVAAPALAQPPSTNLESYALKIFRVESGLYPFVQVYIRTFDQNRQPLANLNELNIGVMVKGRPYDPNKRQYFVQSIRNRDEATRSVIVLDCSGTMAGAPFEDALKAAARFIDSKREQDQVAVIAVNDAQGGYEVVSSFERDAKALGRRLADVQCNAETTQLYDAIAAAMEMSAMASQGGIQSTDADYVASTSILVFSDGKDEGSALSRDDLNRRIAQLDNPIPVYSFAYSKLDSDYLRNLESISRNSFGIYYDIGQATEKMQRTVENVQNILQNDYVVTFRSYIPVDGEEHNVKIGLEYPSRSGKIIYQDGEFEALVPPPVEPVLNAQNRLAEKLPPLPDGNPYMSNPHLQGMQGGGQAAAPEGNAAAEAMRKRNQQ
jgi:Mg-chelatase subunit ChlD